MDRVVAVWSVTQLAQFLWAPSNYLIGIIPYGGSRGSRSTAPPPIIIVHTITTCAHSGVSFFVSLTYHEKMAGRVRGAGQLASQADGWRQPTMHACLRARARTYTH